MHCKTVIIIIVIILFLLIVVKIIVLWGVCVTFFCVYCIILVSVTLMFFVFVYDHVHHIYIYIYEYWPYFMDKPLLINSDLPCGFLCGHQCYQ